MRRYLLALVLTGVVGLPALAQRHRAHEVPLTRAPRRVAPAPRTPAPHFVPLQTPAPPPDTAAAAGAEDDELSVTLITFGPGEDVFERFGHNALWVHDPRAGTDIAWNWGMYDFEQPHFLQRFLSGDTKYWMEGQDAYRQIAGYHDLGRTVTLQRLNLTQAQASALRDFVQWNSLEQNKYYRYDYFRDNCSTRVRDAMDRVLGGALRRATDSVATDLTYRGESVRLTDADKPIQLGIDVALGRPADRPLSEWESFFIPMRLRDALRTVSVPGPDGAPVPLVNDQRTIAPGAGPAITVPDATPKLVLRYLLLGVLLAALVVVLRVLGASRRGALWGLSLIGMIWSLSSGVIGVLLIYMWGFTRHVFWRWNENLLLLSPLSLLLIVLVPAALLRGRATGPARIWSRVIAVLGVVALVLAILPGGQQSPEIVALALPLHLALAWALSVPILLPQRAAIS